jgi:two-component system, chemotaxis family, CheB/CheR fusion protein
MSKKKSVDNKVAKVKTAPVDEPGDAAAKDSTDERFPIVGLGASAGGLEALQSFFSEVSEDSAMAYIVLVHLPPKLPSMMPELLQ